MAKLQNIGFCCLLASLAGIAAADEPRGAADGWGPADTIVGSIADGDLRSLLDEVLDRNPEIAGMSARMAAAGQRTVSVRKLPDPTGGGHGVCLAARDPGRTAAFCGAPQPATARRRQTRHLREGRGLRAPGPRRRAPGPPSRTRQRGPAPGRRTGLSRRGARVLSYDHATLAHYEELARARYASGAGLQMDAIQLQAEMSRLESRQTELDERRAGVVAEINHLRDRPGAAIELGAPAPPTDGGARLEQAPRSSPWSHAPSWRPTDARIERSGRS